MKTYVLSTKRDTEPKDPKVRAESPMGTLLRSLWVLTSMVPKFQNCFTKQKDTGHKVAIVLKPDNSVNHDTVLEDSKLSPGDL